MRKAHFVFLLVVFSLVISAASVAADDVPTWVITVKSLEKNSGVITLQIVRDSKAFELTCNEGMPGCTDLKKGNYKMTELPKNHGVYDCNNVRVYAESAGEDDEKLGEYCLITK
jgi:hypothetical protein